MENPWKVFKEFGVKRRRREECFAQILPFLIHKDSVLNCISDTGLFRLSELINESLPAKVSECGTKKTIIPQPNNSPSVIIRYQSCGQIPLSKEEERRYRFILDIVICGLNEISSNELRREMFLALKKNEKRFERILNCGNTTSLVWDDLKGDFDSDSNGDAPKQGWQTKDSRIRKRFSVEETVKRGLPRNNLIAQLAILLSWDRNTSKPLRMPWKYILAFLSLYECNWINQRLGIWGSVTFYNLDAKIERVPGKYPDIAQAAWLEKLETLMDDERAALGIEKEMAFLLGAEHAIIKQFIPRSHTVVLAFFADSCMSYRDLAKYYLTISAEFRDACLRNMIMFPNEQPKWAALTETELQILVAFLRTKLRNNSKSIGESEIAILDAIRDEIKHIILREISFSSLTGICFETNFPGIKKALTPIEKGKSFLICRGKDGKEELCAFQDKIRSEKNYIDTIIDEVTSVLDSLEITEENLVSLAPQAQFKELKKRSKDVSNS
jgi:hypothetical protein